MDMNVDVDFKIKQDIFQLCYDVIFSDRDVDDKFINDMTNLAEMSHEFASLLLDALQTLDASVDGDENLKNKLSTLVESCIKKKLPNELVKSSTDCLSDDTVNKQLIRMKTRLFYKQLKFNLFREESEGFSKLICELCYADQESSPALVLAKIRCLIGQFNLDPNRVLDVTLECFEAFPQRRSFFIEMLKMHHVSKVDIGHLIGFKFTSYQKKYARASNVDPVPNSLYILAAVLIHEGLLETYQLCSYLCPTLEEALGEFKLLMEPANQRSKQCTTNTKIAQGEILLEAGLAPAPIPPGSEAPLVPAEEMDIGVNQKLGVLWGLVKIGDWKNAHIMLDRLPDYYSTRCIKLALALIDMMDHSIEVFYETKCPGASIQPVTSDPKEHSTIVSDWQSFADHTLCIARYLGPSLALGPLTLTKITRLMAKFMTEFNESEEKQALMSIHNLMVDVCDEVLLPSMTAMPPGNCAYSEELWAYIGQLAYTTRYRLYGRSKLVHTAKHPILTLRRGQMMGRARYVMKRLSKDTHKLNGRQLAKLTHSHPTVVFDHILNQLQTFENFIMPVVDSIRIMSSLQFDILSFCIIDHLSDPGKQKLKVSDAMLSPWLNSLATFVGLVFRKNNMELTGVLQYVANQLKLGTSLDLLVLRNIIENMSGIETTSQLTQEQLEALAGGDLLRQEAGYLGTVRNVKKNSWRLKEALQQEDLAVGLCILMAQQRMGIVYDEGLNIHLKLVGQVYDQCQDTLVQFGSFLFSNVRMEDYSKRMPMAPELISIYKLSLDAAFFLTRHIYSYHIQTRFEKKGKARKLKDGKDASESPEAQNKLYCEAANEVMEPLAKELVVQYSDELWKDIHPRLLCTFWTLTMQDLHVPEEAYAREFEKINKAHVENEASRDMSDSKRRKERDRLSALQNKLIDERDSQREHVTRVSSRLKEESKQWFPARGGPKAHVYSTNHFIEYCIRTRSCFSDLGALYTAKFILLLQDLRVPGFSMITLFDKLFNDVTLWMAGLSENEANYFGRFYNHVMERVTKWFINKSLYDKECLNTPGFEKKLQAAEGATTSLSHVSFESLWRKWQYKLAQSVVLDLSKVTNYITMRNALIILIKILDNFPLVGHYYDMLEKKTEQVRMLEKDRRPDLNLLASSYWGQLKVRREKKMVKFYDPIDEKLPDKVPTTQIKRVVANKQAGAKTTGKGPATNGVSASGPSKVLQKAVNAATAKQSTSAGKPAPSPTLKAPPVPTTSKKPTLKRDTAMKRDAAAAAVQKVGDEIGAKSAKVKDEVDFVAKKARLVPAQMASPPERKRTVVQPQNGGVDDNNGDVNTQDGGSKRRRLAIANDRKTALSPADPQPSKPRELGQDSRKVVTSKESQPLPEASRDRESRKSKESEYDRPRRSTSKDLHEKEPKHSRNSLEDAKSSSRGSTPRKERKEKKRDREGRSSQAPEEKSSKKRDKEKKRKKSVE